MQMKEIHLPGLTLPSNVLMAPLAGYTCYPFRLLCRRLGAGLCFTEMVSCNALKNKDAATQKLLFTTSEEPVKAAQLLGGNPGIMEKMACSGYLEPFDILDINMGCPVPNVVKSGEGSALMGDLKRASAIIRGCKRSGKIITVKCRVGLTEDALIAAEFAKMCEDAGADMLTIHGRTRSMMYDGAPYYDQIEQAVSAVGIPVIANGGIFSAADADAMMERTGADGVMIARYALENPFIFSELAGRETNRGTFGTEDVPEYLSKQYRGRARGMHGDYYEILTEQLRVAANCYDETFALSYIRKIASYCMKKRKGTKRYKEELYRCGSLERMEELLGIIFGRGEEGEWDGRDYDERE